MPFNTSHWSFASTQIEKMLTHDSSNNCATMRLKPAPLFAGCVSHLRCSNFYYWGFDSSFLFLPFSNLPSPPPCGQRASSAIFDLELLLSVGTALPKSMDCERGLFMPSFFLLLFLFSAIVFRPNCAENESSKENERGSRGNCDMRYWSGGFFSQKSRVKWADTHAHNHSTSSGSYCLVTCNRKMDISESLTDWWRWTVPLLLHVISAG